MNTEWFYNSLIAWIWISWTLYWLIAARSAKTTQRRESLVSRLSHVIPLAIGVALIAWPRPPLPWPWLSVRVLPATLMSYWMGVAMLVLGLAFTVWARLHLGRNWSGTVTVKEGHELIRTGPYGWVRHPIYTGLLFAFLGCAIARGEMRAVIGVVLAIAALVLKLRVEERLMREQFGEQYELYASQVPALVPRLF